MTELPAKRSYTLKIAIKHIKPPIWRRVRVPGSLNLAELHLVIQSAFGWTNTHLHSFEIGDKIYSDPRSMDGAAELDENRFSLDGALGTRVKSVLYTYDFGDGWEHAITVEKREPASVENLTPVCLAGKRACPPEDCGGPWGYGDLLEAVKNPNSERHQELSEWIDLDLLDPEEFDLAETNAQVAKFREATDLDDW